MNIVDIVDETWVQTQHPVVATATWISTEKWHVARLGWWRLQSFISGEAKGKAEHRQVRDISAPKQLQICQEDWR